MHAYWWRPWRSPDEAWGQLRTNAAAWARVTAAGRRRPTNFGDEFAPAVLAALTGQRVRWTPIDDAEVVGLGSLGNRYLLGTRRARLFGTGLREAPPPGTTLPAERVLGLRGAASAAALGLPAALGIGDPGLVVRELVSPRRTPRREPVLIPHFSAFASPRTRALLRGCAADGCTVMPPNRPWREVATAVRDASAVISSSLHGIVFADSFGVPAIWTRMPGTIEPDLKYHDHDSAFGLRARATEFGPNETADGFMRTNLHAAEVRSIYVAEQLDNRLGRLYALARSL